MTANPPRAAGLTVPGLIAWPLVVGGLLVLLWHAYGNAPTPPATIESTGPKIEDVRRIAKLAILRVQVANVIEGQTRGARAIVAVRGDADISLDLDQIEIAERKDAAKTAVLRLGTPRVDRPRVDHEHTKVFELRETGLAALNPFADPRQDLLEDCMRAAQEQVDIAVQESEYIEQAKVQAEVLLSSFYRELGWDVRIEWQ